MPDSLSVDPTDELERRRALARRGASYLYERGAGKVWLFGSVAKGRRQDERSDLDLAVAGLPPEVYFRAVSELERILDVDVDLVEVERASPVLREAIVRDGIELPRSGQAS
jgi:predicted nucleotidyltransferase